MRLTESNYAVTLQLLLAGIIDLRTARDYVRNYEELAAHEAVLSQQYRRRWVASIRGHFYAAKTEAALLKKIRKIKGSRHALIIQF